MIKFDYFVERPKSEILYILFKRYVSTLWSIAWHTLSTWVNEGPHWNRWILSLLNVIKWIIHFQVVQHLGGGPMHVIFITCMGYPFNMSKKLMILKVFTLPNVIHHAKYYWARISKKMLQQLLPIFQCRKNLMIFLCVENLKSSQLQVIHDSG